MELNRQTIKSLSSETRVDILKSLARRRKMPAELSKEFKLAASTVSEHLKNLEDSNLVKKKETGHKWIYYELTEKGQMLVKPQYTPQFVVVLVLGGLIFLVGFTGFLTPFTEQPFSAFPLSNGLMKSPEVREMETFEGNFSNNMLPLAAGSENNLETKEFNESQTFEKKPIERVEKTSSISLYAVALLVLGSALILTSFVLPKKYKLEV